MSIQKTKKQRKPKTKRLYFGPEVDISIIRYNETESSFDRSLIYQREIRPAFEKLVENIIHTFKFYYTDGQTLQQLQHEVVSFLVEKLPKFKQENGKAFSYFSIVAKHYCIHKNNNNYKKLTTHDSIDLSDDLELVDTPSNYDQELMLANFVEVFVNYWDDNISQTFTKKNDLELASAIIELFRRRDRIEIFNKKALYIYIREMTNANTQQITKMVKVMKDKYKAMYMDFLKYGVLPKDKTY